MEKSIPQGQPQKPQEKSSKQSPTLQGERLDSKNALLDTVGGLGRTKFSTLPAEMQGNAREVSPNETLNESGEPQEQTQGSFFSRQAREQRTQEQTQNQNQDETPIQQETGGYGEEEESYEAYGGYEEESTEPQGEIIEITMPGTHEKAQIELSTDPVIRRKQLQMLATGHQAYLKGKKIVEEKAPELAPEWHRLMERITNVTEKLAERETAPQQESTDFRDYLTEKQKIAYQMDVDEEGEPRANRRWESIAIQNKMWLDREKKIAQMENRMNQDSQRQVIRQQVGLFRQLDKSLPDPRRNVQAFEQAFFKGYGGYLLDQGFSEEQIYLNDRINHEKFYKDYLQESGGKPNLKTDFPDLENVEIKVKTISPDVVAKIQKDMGSGSHASVGRNSKMADFKKLTPKQRRELASRDPYYAEKLSEDIGLSKWFPIRRNEKKR